MPRAPRSVRKSLARRPGSLGISRAPAPAPDGGKRRPSPAAVYLASLAPGSRRTMAAALEVIARLIGGRQSTVASLPWGALRHEHVAAVRAKLIERRFAPATANKMLAALRGVLKQAWRLGLIPAEDLARAIDVPRVRGERALAGRALKPEEVAAILRTCDEDAVSNRPGARFRGARDAAVIALLFAGGLRRSEAVALSLHDYDPEEGSVRVLGKGNKERVTFISPSARARLDAYIAVRGRRAGALLAANDGLVGTGTLGENTLYMLLRARAGRAGVPAFSPHDLRRTCISTLLDAGADISSAQRLAGHANVATTQRYDRRGEQTIRRAADLLVVPGPAGRSAGRGRAQTSKPLGGPE